MKFSIITACKNSAETIRDALESVKAQKGAEVEHIVVDGASTDGTVEILREYDPGIRWVSEPDRGLYDALNKGIRMATGDVVGILNADDVLDGTDVLARIAAEWERAADPELECLYGSVRFVKELGGRSHRRCFVRFWRPWMLQWGYMPPHPGLYIRRDCFGRWGGYEPDRREYRIAADYELIIRYFRVHRMKARWMPVCTTVMRTGGVSTRDVEARRKLNEEIVKGNRANGYFCIFPMLLPKYAIKIWEFILPRLRRDHA